MEVLSNFNYFRLRNFVNSLALTFVQTLTNQHNVFQISKHIVDIIYIFFRINCWMFTLLTPFTLLNTFKDFKDISHFSY